MKKWNEDRLGCKSCYGANDNCTNWRLSLVSKGMCPDFCCHPERKCYANKEECERLLKLWDDANGSIAEWRENDRFMLKWREGGLCTSCFFNKQCISHQDTYKRLFNEDANIEYRCYVNKTLTEALLKWHDDRYGKIGDLAKTPNCPRCDSNDSMMAPDCGTGRICHECHTEWRTDLVYTEELSKNEKAVEDMDFRVGDAVTEITTVHGIVRSVNGDEVMIKLDDNDSLVPFCKDPERDGGGDIATIYHGHNLKITVEEKRPVRMVEKWLTVFMEVGTGEIDAVLRNNECDMEPNLGNIIIHGPVRVKIPE